MLNDSEWVGNAPGPEGIPDFVDLGFKFPGYHSWLLGFSEQKVMLKRLVDMANLLGAFCDQLYIYMMGHLFR